MANRLKNEEKIQKIQSDRETIDNLIKSNITNHHTKMSSDIDNMVSQLSNDAKMYNTLVKCQKMIKSFIEQIKSAKTVEEITEIRGRLNYYINIIKKELIKRNVSSEQLNQYLDNTAYLRRDIALYVRFLKREDKIREASALLSNPNLNSEEKKLLTRKLRNELNFNLRMINDCNNEEIKPRRVNISHDNELVLPVVPNDEQQDSVVLPDNLDVVPSDEQQYSIVLPEQYLEPTTNNNPSAPYDPEVVDFFRPIDKKSAALSDDELGKLISEYNPGEESNNKTKIVDYRLYVYRVIVLLKKYGIEIEKKYGRNVILNIKYFLDNMLIHVRNNSKLKRMKNDSYVGYFYEDFRAAIDFVYANNTIQYPLNRLLYMTKLSRHGRNIRHKYPRGFFEDIENNYNNIEGVPGINTQEDSIARSLVLTGNN